MMLTDVVQSADGLYYTTDYGDDAAGVGVEDDEGGYEGEVRGFVAEGVEKSSPRRPRLRVAANPEAMGVGENDTSGWAAADGTVERRRLIEVDHVRFQIRLAQIQRLQEPSILVDYEGAAAVGCDCGLASVPTPHRLSTDDAVGNGRVAKHDFAARVPIERVVEAGDFEKAQGLVRHTAEAARPGRILRLPGQRFGRGLKE